MCVLHGVHMDSEIGSHDTYKSLNFYYSDSLLAKPSSPEQYDLRFLLYLRLWGSSTTVTVKRDFSDFSE